jgi:hypothetical protein
MMGVSVRITCSSQFNQKTNMMKRLGKMCTSKLASLGYGSMDLFREAANIYFDTGWIGLEPDGPDTFYDHML